MDHSEILKALEKLEEGAWREHDSLRHHEWKIAITIWSSLAILIGSILIHPVNIFPKCWIVVTFALAGFLICILHGWYILGVARVQDLSRRKEEFFREKIMCLLNIEYNKEIADIIREIEEKKRGRKNKRIATFKHWSSGFQMWFTLFLVIVAIIAISLPRNNNEQSKKVTIEEPITIKSLPTDLHALTPAPSVKTTIDSNEKDPEGRLKPRP
jgi:hypothetical protein